MYSLKKLTIAVIITVALIYIAGCSSGQEPMGTTGTERPSQAQSGSSFQDIGAEQAEKLIENDKTTQLIDVREEYEYQQGYIPGAKLIPLGQLVSRMDEIDKAKPVLLYCATGARSASAGQLLTESGYTKVYNLEGGIVGWPYDVETKR